MFYIFCKQFVNNVRRFFNHTISSLIYTNRCDRKCWNIFDISIHQLLRCIDIPQLYDLLKLSIIVVRLIYAKTPDNRVKTCRRTLGGLPDRWDGMGDWPIWMSHITIDLIINFYWFLAKIDFTNLSIKSLSSDEIIIKGWGIPTL